MSNQTIAARLFLSIREGRAPHAILLAGPEGSGADDLARRAAAVCCLGRDDPAGLVNCPDYYALGPEPIKVDQVRGVIGALSRRAFRGKRAVNLFAAHRMTPQAQNALLKTLEEPPAETLLLLSGREEGLLPTILSRCALLRLGAEPEDSVRRMLMQEGFTEEDAALAAALGDGAPQLAKAFAAEEYRTLRREAMGLFREALSGLPPYEACRALLERPTGPGPEPGKAELRRRAAEAVTGVWLSLARDALRLSIGAGEPVNRDAAGEVRRLAERFTTGQIQSMIVLLMQAAGRLSEASPQLTMDRLLTALLDIVSPPAGEAGRNHWKSNRA